MYDLFKGIELLCKIVTTHAQMPLKLTSGPHCIQLLPWKALKTLVSMIFGIKLYNGNFTINDNSAINGNYH